MLNLIPKGIFLDDLKEECDYLLEAEKQTKFKNITENEKFIHVPTVIKELTTKEVLVSEFVEGVSVDELRNVSQKIRNHIGETLLKLCLDEIFVHRFMQTDPNPANFTYDSVGDRLNLIDFGAARDYGEEFCNNYMMIVHGGAKKDKEQVLKYSKDIGFLTGYENDVFKDSHNLAIHAIAAPFNSTGKFDFGNTEMTKTIYQLIPLMLRHRLKSPPSEIYTLHRKLSGVYLMCIHLKAQVDVKAHFEQIYEKYYKRKCEII